MLIFKTNKIDTFLTYFLQNSNIKQKNFQHKDK